MGPEPIQTAEGTTRVVAIAGGYAAKFARGDEGRRCNLEEARLWRLYSATPGRGESLCPVVWCSSDGAILLMEAAEPLPEGAEPWHQADEAWDYRAGGDDGSPWEGKIADWGLLRGRPVAVDYALHAMAQSHPRSNDFTS